MSWLGLGIFFWNRETQMWLRHLDHTWCKVPKHHHLRSRPSSLAWAVIWPPWTYRQGVLEKCRSWEQNRGISKISTRQKSAETYVLVPKSNAKIWFQTFLKLFFFLCVILVSGKGSYLLKPGPGLPPSFSMLEANCFDCHGVEVWIGGKSSLSTAFFLNPIQPRRWRRPLQSILSFIRHAPKLTVGKRGVMVLEQWSMVNGGNE